MKLPNIKFPRSNQNTINSKMKKSALIFVVLLIILIILAKIPATSNWPVVGWVRNLTGYALSSDEQYMKSWHDSERKKAFTTSEGLSNKAREHSTRMAAAGDIWHASEAKLWEDSKAACSNATVVGENVGMAGSIEEMLVLFKNSKKHYDNVKDMSYTTIGVGIVHKDGTYYATIRFVVCPDSSRSTTNNTTNEGSNTTQNTTSSPPASVPTGPAGYLYCVKEGSTCAFSGPRSLAYGTNGKYTYKRFTTVGNTSASCNSSTFGNPNSGSTNGCFVNLLPLTPTDLRVTSVECNRLRVAWSPGSDDNGIKGYNVYLNGAFRGGPVNVLATDLAGLTASTRYRITVLSVDNKDDLSAPTDSRNSGRVYEIYTTTNPRC